jgi:hypothetical protein
MPKGFDVTTRVRYIVGEVGHRRAAEYALRTVLEMIVDPQSVARADSLNEVRAGEVAVTYGIALYANGSGVCIFASDFFGAEYCTTTSMPTHPVVRVEGIPALYHSDGLPSDQFYTVNAGIRETRVDCHVDVVAGSFFMLSRCEEVVSPSVDQFNRFPAEASLAWQEGFLQEAVVNAYAEKLLDMLRAAGFTGERRRWWCGAPWAVALTHDIDGLARFPRKRPPVNAVIRALKNQQTAGEPGLRVLLSDYVQTITRGKMDEYDCLSDMATWEASAGIHAAYYFLADSETRGYGADYHVDSAAGATKVEAVARLGHEVGFHAGFHAYDKADQFHAELKRLQSIGVPIYGGRGHYLRWQTPQTWRLWAEEGLSYDATLGYSKVAGFRCGICLPFHPYDIENDREMSISEWPLMFMDATYESSWSEGTMVLSRLSQECQRYGGVLVLLWHNRNWSKLYAPAVREHFQEFLQRCVTQGVAVNSINGLTRLSDATLVDQTRPAMGAS